MAHPPSSFRPSVREFLMAFARSPLCNLAVGPASVRYAMSGRDRDPQVPMVMHYCQSRKLERGTQH